MQPWKRNQYKIKTLNDANIGKTIIKDAFIKSQKM